MRRNHPAYALFASQGKNVKFIFVTYLIFPGIYKVIDVFRIIQVIERIAILETDPGNEDSIFSIYKYTELLNAGVVWNVTLVFFVLP